jgi:hypothetical protein
MLKKGEIPINEVSMMLIRMRDVMALAEQAARQAVRPKSAVDKRAAKSLLSVAAASKLIGVCTRTFKGHVDAGEIPYILVGRGLQRQRKMFDPADLEKFKQTRRRFSCPSTSAAKRTNTSLTSGSKASALFRQYWLHDEARSPRL